MGPLVDSLQPETTINVRPTTQSNPLRRRNLGISILRSSGHNPTHTITVLWAFGYSEQSPVVQANSSPPQEFIRQVRHSGLEGLIQVIRQLPIRHCSTAWACCWAL